MLLGRTVIMEAQNVALQLDGKVDALMRVCFACAPKQDVG